MISINVFSDEKAWSKRLKNNNIFFKKICNAFPKKYKFLNKKISFSLLLSNNKKIKILNKKFRNKNKSTDVLSFPFYEKKILLKLLKKKNLKIYLGDIVINIKKIPFKNNIKDFQKKFDELWIHGLAHLLGGRHKTNKDFNSMSRVEKKFLNIIK